MAGILNSKQRIMDFIVTKAGRSLMSKGTYEVSFVSFSDKGVFYRENTAGVADDAENRIVFEATSFPYMTQLYLE